MRKVLVTGSSGFIGSYIVRELAERGHAVVGLDVREPDQETAFIQGPARQATSLVLGNLQQWSTIAQATLDHRPDVIVHNASFVRPDVLATEPTRAVRENLDTSLTVFEAARVFGVRRVIYMSSIGVLPPLLHRPINADHPLITAAAATPDTFYGAAKIASEAFAFAYHHAFDLDVLIVRPSAVYGFGMRWPIYIKPMVENSVIGIPTVFEEGADMPRDYTHAVDVARLVSDCAEIDPADVRDRVFYAGTGEEPVTAGQVANIVRDLVPEAQIEIGPGIPESERRDALTRGAFDMSSAREQLHFDPLFTDVRDGIKEYMGRYREYLARQAARSESSST